MRQLISRGALLPICAALAVLAVVERLSVPVAAGEALGVERLSDWVITEICGLRSDVVTKFHKVGIAKRVSIANKAERDRDLRDRGVLENLGPEDHCGPCDTAFRADDVTKPIRFWRLTPRDHFIHIFRT